MIDKINDTNHLTDIDKLDAIHLDVATFINESRDKITNLFGEKIEYEDRLNMLMKQPYIKELTLEELQNHYIYYLNELIKLHLFNHNELLKAFNFIIDILVKKESEK